MGEFAAVAIVIGAIFALLGTGVWVGLSLIGVAFIALEFVAGRSAGGSMFFSVWPSASAWSLTALPMFVWMGEILYRTRLSQDLFKGLAPWLAKLPGGLMHTNIVGCTVFAAVSGSSAATLSTVGRMSIPELRARDYPENMIVGTLAGAATLGPHDPALAHAHRLRRLDQRLHPRALHRGHRARPGARLLLHGLRRDHLEGVVAMEPAARARHDVPRKGEQFRLPDPGLGAHRRRHRLHVPAVRPGLLRQRGGRRRRRRRPGAGLRARARSTAKPSSPP